MRPLAIAVFLAGLAGPACAEWSKDGLPPFVSWSEIDPRAVAIDSRTAWAACHTERPGQHYFAPAEEARAIAATGHARRAGNRLRVGAARFLDNAGPEAEADFVQHAYVGRYRTAPVDLVRVGYYESVDWILVDRASGAKLKFGGFPVMGPDRRSFVAVGEAEDEGLMGVEVGAWARGRFRMQAQIDLLYPCDAVWLSPDLIELKAMRTATQAVPGAMADPASWERVRIRKRHGRWRVERPQP